MSLLQQRTSSHQGSVVPVSAILFDESVLEPAIVTAPKIRKKRVKRVNWTYVPVNSTDLVHVDDFTIAAMAESSVERSVQRSDEPIVRPMDKPRGEPCNERSVDERSVERSAEPIV